MLAGVVTGLVLLVALSVWAATRSTTRSLLTHSCTTPALALGRAVTGDGRGIAWAVTGPQADAYAVLVDGRTIATPTFRECTADGTLPPLAPGAHRVELRRGTATVATALLTG